MIGAVFAAAAMMTTWGEKVTSDNVWREYPRPQMVRANWQNLNGDWDWAVTSVTNTPGRPTKWEGKIRVPYAIESRLSGVGRLIQPDEFLWYTRTITCNPRKGVRTLLHFGGVDFRTMVFIGHTEVTDVPHEGGQNPFTIDITPYVKPGANELTICVWDPTQDFVNSRGKQCFNPGGCFYTRVSGIWQTVWMEEVPETYIESYRVTPDIDRGEVAFTFKPVGEEPDEDIKIEVFDAEGQKVASGKADATRSLVVKMPKDFKLWSPESPYLYTFKAKFERDAFEGYFGMRKFAKQKDKDGYLRFFLNNKPYFILGTLDQGWWPDGLLTPPSEEAMAFDIKTLKDCGFNMMRKHIKVEPLRYYALCDKMGILVLQDMPSGSDDSNDPMRVEAVKRYGLYREELRQMMDTLYNAPSIVMWVPYNEGWTQPGQFLTHSTLDFVRRYDPTRLVNGPSGCWDWEGGHLLPEGWAWEKRVLTQHLPAGVCEASDAVDMHLYRGPTMFAVNDRRVSFLGEFGGLGHPVEGHLWKEAKGSWGYGGIEDTKTREGLEKTYLDLMKKVEELAAKGLGGSVYTQTTDVEVEINGLLTYDRKVLKYNPEVLRKAHDAIRARVESR
ncbi:MAG: glycoside hydrolase family 2 protein [Kiritimatiellia bacterium]